MMQWYGAESHRLLRLELQLIGWQRGTESRNHTKAISVAIPPRDLLHVHLVLLGILLTILVLLASQLPIPSAEAKFPQGNYGNVEQTYAVFTMIAVAIAGFGILLALYTRESFTLKGS